MSRLISFATLLFVITTAPAEELLPLAEYEVRSIEAAVNRELAAAKDAIRDGGMGRQQEARTRQFMATLNNELRALGTLEPGEMPVATIARGAESVRYPSVGALLQNRETICSGNIVAPRAFVTARHCFHDSDNPGDFAVFLQHGGFHRIENIVLPPDGKFDIALLVLEDSVTGIPASELAHEMVPPATKLQIVGFGITETNARDSGIKRQGSIITRACAESPELFICWDFNQPYEPQESDSNVCSRDSGGPVGSARDDHLAIEDGVSIRISPHLDCHQQSQSWSQAIHAALAWLTSEVAAIPSGTPAGDPIADCCGDHAAVWARHGVLGGGGSVVHSVTEPTDVRLVRVSLSATDIPSLDYSLNVYANGSQQDPTKCLDYGRYVSCEFAYDVPVPMGTWNVRVNHEAGETGMYQLVVTMFE